MLVTQWNNLDKLDTTTYMASLLFLVHNHTYKNVLNR